MEWLAVLDRFEGDLAVLIPSERPECRVEIHRALLPRGARDGVFLRVRIDLDAGETRRGAAEIARLQEELSGEGGDP